MVSSAHPHKIAIIDNIVVGQSGSFRASGCPLSRKHENKQLIWKGENVVKGAYGSELDVGRFVKLNLSLDVFDVDHFAGSCHLHHVLKTPCSPAWSAKSKKNKTLNRDERPNWQHCLRPCQIISTNMLASKLVISIVHLKLKQHITEIDITNK